MTTALLLSARWIPRRIAGALIEVLLPSTCVACDASLEGFVGPSCAECLARLRSEECTVRCVECSGHVPEPHAGRSRCPSCAEPRRLRVEAPRIHAGVARALVHALKYARRRDAADVLARITSADARVRTALGEADLIVPVPADPVRRRERGYKVAELLAEGLAELAPGPRRVTIRAALAIRRSNPQVGRSASERRTAPKGTMRARWHSRWGIRGRRVILVDDVVTTGATLEEAARVLRRLGAARIVAVTCTRAEGELLGAPEAKGSSLGSGLPAVQASAVAP
jgi:ComF family protein